MKVLYRADGSPDIGTGHIVRGLILRRPLAAMGAQVTFLTRDSPWGVQTLRRAGCDVILMPPGANLQIECEALRDALSTVAPAVCVTDILETSESLTRTVREAGVSLVCLDDVGPGRLNANAIVNILEVEPAPDILTERRIALYEGPQYAPLPEPYQEPGIAEREIPRQVRRILVSLGGADPAALAPKAARALKLALESRRASAAFEKPHVTLVIGAASRRRGEVMRAIGGRQDSFTIMDSVPCLLPLLREADLGLIAGGLTMHEALAVGLPSIALCQRVRHQAELAQRLADEGAMLTLGVGAGVTETRIADAVLDLAADRELRRRLARRGPQLVDGHGAQRTAEVISRIVHAA